MICKNCGAKIAKNSFFCDNCGRSIGTVEELAEFSKKERQHKRKTRTALTTVALIIGICSFIAGRAYITKDTVKPAKTPTPSLAAAVKKDDTKVGETPLPTLTTTTVPQQSPIVTAVPKKSPTPVPTVVPTVISTVMPTIIPTVIPTAMPTPSEMPTETTTEFNPTDSSYMFPSDTTVITAENLASYSKSQLRIIRNEIYARHGYCFKQKELQDYFATKTWYKPNPSLSTTQVFAMFNETEKRNNKLIVEYEKANRQ